MDGDPGRGLADWERVPPPAYLLALRDGVLPEYLQALQALRRAPGFLLDQEIEKPPRPREDSEGPLPWALEPWVYSPAQLIIRPGPRLSIKGTDGIPFQDVGPLDGARSRLKEPIALAIEESGVLLEESGAPPLPLLIDGTLRTLHAWVLDQSSVPRWHPPTYPWPHGDTRGPADDPAMPLRRRIERAFDRALGEVRLPTSPDPTAMALIAEVHEDLVPVAEALVVLRESGSHSGAQRLVADLLNLGGTLMAAPMPMPRRREREVMLSQWLQELRGRERRTGAAESVLTAAGLRLSQDSSDAVLQRQTAGRPEKLFTPLAEIIYKHMWERLYGYRWHDQGRGLPPSAKRPGRRPENRAISATAGVLSLIYPAAWLFPATPGKRTQTRLYKSVRRSCYGNTGLSRRPRGSSL